MEERIKVRFNDAVLQDAMRRYGIATGDIELLDGFESFMYEFRRESAEYILRIGHSLRRSIPLIRGEVDWINALADGGAGVARAVESQAGNLVELLDDGYGEHFLATAFVKAKGGPGWEQPGWHSPEFLERYGRLVGRIHALSKQYTPADPAWKRPQWDDAIMLDADKWIPDQPISLERFWGVMRHLRALSKDHETYGLIHFDAHPGNFFVDANLNITLFDFDDCNYSWYANDIAIVFFYNIMGKNNTPDFAEKFGTHFLRGYAQETRLDPAWLREIPYFLKLREIDLYAIIHRSFDVANLDDPWVANYMAGRRECIENDVPVIDFDFTSLAKILA